MHIVSKFQFFTHISIVVKLKNKIQNFKRGKKKEKKSLFLQLFQLIDDKISHAIGLLTGLLVRRDSSRTELFDSTADSANALEDDRYDQLFIEASRRISDNADSAATATGSTARSNYSRNVTARNFFDEV